ncbi:hypothetical protein [Geobacillus zalihae]|nr:hypothetical protein [Geobacillus zalihae]
MARPDERVVIAIDGYQRKLIEAIDRDPALAEQFGLPSQGANE